MKIKDVVQESLYDFYTKSIAAGQQADAMARSRQSTYKQGIVPDATPLPEPGQQPTLAKQVRNPPQGTIILIKDPRGMEYFKNYKGIWFEKPDPREKFVASGALQIKDPVRVDRLNDMITQVGGVMLAVKPEFPGYDTFILDPAAQARMDKRQQALMAKRQRTKK